ncbi:MAG TPA: hypothetical protein PLZ15_08420 [Melioribacteraceae bacterium]|nr:hypothetical protein [Melioribacteraceae bacterium]
MSNAEEGLLALGILILIFLFYLLKSYFEDTAPLTESEITNLARKRRLRIFAERIKLDEYSFSIDAETKKRFGSKLKYYECDIDIGLFPSWSAGILKGKKHEWLIIGIGDMKSVHGFWMEKGHDNKSIQTSLSSIELTERLNKEGVNNLLLVHNHPNSTLNPSKEDKDCLLEIFSKYNKGSINVLGFIAGRGMQKLFACFIISSLISFEEIRTEIINTNDKSRKTNGNLRNELRERISYIGKIFHEDNLIHNLGN